MKPKITEFTATVAGVPCAFKRKGSGFLERPVDVVPPGKDFEPHDVWTMTLPGGQTVRFPVAPGSGVEVVCAAAEERIRQRNAAAFEILRGHLVGECSGVIDGGFHDVYLALGAENLLRGGDRHRIGMTSFAEADGTRRARSR